MAIPMGKSPPSIIQCMDAPRIWGKQFAGPSWHASRALLKALFALPMDDEEAAIYRECTGRTTLPTEPFSEAAIIAGRRSGKSRILAAIAAFMGCFVDWTPYLAAGEMCTICCICVDRSQARTL